MSIQFTNDATTFLAANINASVTTITVVDASSFPTLAAGDHTYITLSTPTNDTKEIVKCTAIAGNTLTVIRAQEGTTAASFTIEDRAQIRITAQLFRDIMLAYASLNSYRYTATAGQTTFTGTDIHSATLAYLPNNIIVMLNGVGMGTVDYTATDGSSIVFNVGATLNDEITIVAFTAFGVSDHYKKSETDALLAGKVDDSQVLTNVPSGALFTDTAYTHPANHAISVITGLQAALDGKVDDSQVLTNVPSGALFTDTNTVYTHPSNHAISVITGLQAALDGKTTESYVNTAVSNLVDSSPAALNTLNELAAALGDDANFSTTTATALGLRVAKDSANGAASMPTGTTAQRPTGALGMFRHNTTLNQFEGYNDGAWGALAGGDEVSFVTYEYIATAGQTTFSGADSNSLTLAYTPANIIVSYGGQDLPHSDYTATNGTSVVLDDGAVVGEIVRIVAFQSFVVANTYTQSQADVLLAAKATNTALALKAPIASPVFTGPVGVDGNNAYTAKTRFTYGSSAPTYFSDWGYKSSSDGNKVFLTITDGGSAKDVLVADFKGNVGVGVAPETDWNAVWSVAQVGNSALASTSGNNQMSLSQNAKLTSTSSNSGAKYIETEQASQYVQENGNHHFKVAPSGSADAAISFTNAMTIGNTGALESFATAAGNYGFTTTNNGATPYGQLIYMPNGTNGTVQAFLVCRDGSNGNTNRFLIYANGNVANVNNSYGAISDRKLKENIEDASSQWDDIKAVRVRNYSLIADGESTANRIGVIAQELEDSGMSGLVNESNDTDEVLDVDWIPSEGETEDDRPTKRVDLGTTTKSVKYSILYMKAIKALQEAIIKIEALENRIEALEGAAP